MTTVDLISRHGQQRIDLLTDGEPDQLGAARIVPGNLPGTIKAIIVGNDDMHPGCVGPMMDGNFLHSSDSRFAAECERVLGARFYGAVALHDRYETVGQYADLSA